MATFDELIKEIESRYCLGSRGGALVQETVRLISAQPGGRDGFLDRLKAAGFAVEVASWFEGGDPVPLSGQELEEALGRDVIHEIAHKAEISQSFARTILGYAIPKIIALLAEGATVPSANPPSESIRLDSVIPLSSSPAAESALQEAEQIRPSKPEHTDAIPRRASSRFKKFLAYGPGAAVAACLLGFAWAASQFSAERTEMLGRVQKMSEEIETLKADVGALRFAQNQSGTEATVVEDLKTRLDGVKGETSASLAELRDKVEQMQRESATMISQVIERLDGALPAAPQTTDSTSQPAASARKQTQIAAAPVKLVPENEHGKKKLGDPSAFDPSQNSSAPRTPGSFASPLLAPGGPQLITTWVVRDVYNGIALLESPHGSIEVTPGEIIPGAGRVKSIERRGSGWVVITTRGVVDSARDSLEP